MTEEFDNPNSMQGTLLTASEDKLIKIWDRSSGQMAATMRHRGQPIYSVDTNGQVIVAGTSQDVVFWDIRNLKVPMAILEESHGDEVTAVRFNSKNYQKVISCANKHIQVPHPPPLTSPNKST